MQKLDVMPKWNELFLPVIKYYGDGELHNNRAAKADIADSLNLNEELRHEVNKKARDNKIENRIGWALSALKTAGLMESSEKGYSRISDAGKTLLNNLPSVLDEKYLLNNYPAYRARHERNHSDKQGKGQTSGEKVEIIDYPPQELIENAIDELDSQLSSELLERLYVLNPYDFEKVVADLLDKMGYGELTVTKKSGDGGIDAIVNEDKLGLDKIFVQAKRYGENNPVSEKQVRDFLGALSANQAQRGIFVTTSHFCNAAVKTARISDKKIRLVEGNELAKLMIEYGVGTSKMRSYDIKTLDADYFDNL